jgi:hypothetical protein
LTELRTTEYWLEGVEGVSKEAANGFKELVDELADAGIAFA